MFDVTPQIPKQRPHALAQYFNIHLSNNYNDSLSYVLSLLLFITVKNIKAPSNKLYQKGPDLIILTKNTISFHLISVQTQPAYRTSPVHRQFVAK